MRISDWSSDVCSSDLSDLGGLRLRTVAAKDLTCCAFPLKAVGEEGHRSEEHTSELQSLMRISYAVFCLKKKNTNFHRSNRRTGYIQTCYSTQKTIYRYQKSTQST